MLNQFSKTFLSLSLLFTTITHAMTIDTNEVSNGSCPGETITEIDNLTTSFNESATGFMQFGWDIDRLNFTVGESGTIKISLSSLEALTIKAGNTCNSETFFRSSSKIDHFEEFNVVAGDTINISIFDWSTSYGYDYNLGIEFISD